MSDLHEQFPPLKVSSEKLAAIAERAREQHRKMNPAGTRLNAGGLGAPSKFRAILQSYMHGAGVGVLDLAAIAAVLFLSISALLMYFNGRRTSTTPTNEPKVVVVKPTAQPKESTHSVAGDCTETPKTPDPVQPPAESPPVIEASRKTDEDKTAQIESLFREAVDLYQQGKYSESQHKLRDLLALDPRKELAARMVDEAGTKFMGKMMADTRMGTEPTQIWQYYRQYNSAKNANPDRIIDDHERGLSPDPVKQTRVDAPVTLPPADIPVPAEPLEKISAIPGTGDPLNTTVANDEYRGGFGIRSGGGRRLMVKRYSGSRDTENAVELALRWLAYHQEADGHWDAEKYSAANRTDTAVTALSTLAFLAAGHTEKVGLYKENVKRAVAWLSSKQDATGLIFDTADAGAHRAIGYPGAIATLAMVEAAGMAHVPATLKSAQAAIDYCTQIHQQGEGADKLGWRYQPNTPGDICVSTWFTAALKSAKVAGLNVKHNAFDGAIRFLDSVEKKHANGISKYSYMPGTEANKRRNAMGNYCRMMLGWKAEDLKASTEWFIQDGGTPSWGANGETVDLYYWYYGSLCAFQQGGDVWNSWNASLKKALCENQCKAGDDAGSWPVVGDFSGEWGRVGQTALACLSLEVYYRYPRINPAPAANPAAAPIKQLPEAPQKNPAAVPDTKKPSQEEF
jgi:hypothetical protein